MIKPFTVVTYDKFYGGFEKTHLDFYRHDSFIEWANLQKTTEEHSEEIIKELVQLEEKAKSHFKSYEATHR